MLVLISLLYLICCLCCLMLALFSMLIYIDDFARFALLTLLALLALLCMCLLILFVFVCLPCFRCLLSLLNCLGLPFTEYNKKTDVQGLRLGYILKPQALFVNTRFHPEQGVWICAFSLNQCENEDNVHIILLSSPWASQLFPMPCCLVLPPSAAGR